MDSGTSVFVGFSILLLAGTIFGVLYLARADARGGVFQDLAEHGARDIGSAALELHAMLEPDRRYLLEAQRTDEAAERAQNDGEVTPGEPPPEGWTDADWSEPVPGDDASSGGDSGGDADSGTS